MAPPRTNRSRFRAPGPALAAAVLMAAWLLAGCAATPPSGTGGKGEAGRGGWSTLPVRLAPPPEAPWRPAQPPGCDCPGPVHDRAARRALADAAELFGYGEGGDAIVVLEMYLDRHPTPDPLVLLTLGQLYVMAGWGDPGMAPREGPAPATGDWPHDKRRFLTRARRLLARAAAIHPDDAVPLYLMADAARAEGNPAAADSLWSAALDRCPCPESFAVPVRYQELGPHPPEQESGVAPVYPEAAAREGVSGSVLLDVLVAADGSVRQVDVVASPDHRLARAAAAAFREARFRAGRLGKYPVWSWMRVEVAFH